jgi:hypothetical protein
VDPSYFIVGAVIISLTLMQLNQRLASPLISIVDRWLRWLVFAFGAAQICAEFNWIDRPLWVLATVFFLVWFLGETVYNWMLITAESLSPLPLFPRYVLNTSGEEWPVQRRLLKVREWLKSQGFRQVQALKAEIGGGIFLRASVYQDGSGTVRVQVTFLPQANGVVAACFGVTSVTADGTRYVTDNLYIPFGGFFPESWLVARSPWTRSLPALIKRHRARIAAAGAAVVPFATEPLEDMHASQHEIDRINTELGFLYPHNEREDLGKFTQEGRYRVWKEIWMLNYLGRAARYF